MNFLNLASLFGGDWKDRWQDASFRGIPFLTENLSTEIGRRTIVHEYPYQDVPSTEDMGQKARKYTVNAYVLGDDHDLQRNRLIKAIETKGTGDLIHPEYGLQTVTIESCTVATNEQQRITRFALVFVQAGKIRFPEYQRNVLFDLIDLYYKLTSTLLEKLAGLLQFGVNILALKTQFRTLADLYRRSGYTLAIDPSTGLPVGVSAASLLTPANAAAQIHAALLQPLQAQLPNPQTDWTAAPTTTPTLTAITSGIALLQQLQQASSSTDPTSAIMLQHAYPAALAQTLASAAQLQYESVEQAQTLRQTLHTHLIAVAQGETGDSTIDLLRDLLTVVDAAAEQQLATLPHIVYLTPTSETPALTLVWRHLHDSTRTEQLLARNPHILHPLFVPSDKPVELLQ